MVATKIRHNVWTASVLLALMGGVQAAMAACPPPPAGAETPASTPERLLCQNNEIYQSTRERSLAQQLEDAQRRLDQLELQRRLDAMQPVLPPAPVIPPMPAMPDLTS